MSLLSLDQLEPEVDVMFRKVPLVLLCVGSLAVAGCQAVSPSVGQLQLEANGEDFVRQGFTSKDGWQIRFDHVYVHLSGLEAYQADPPFDPDANQELAAISSVKLPAQTVDLAASDSEENPVIVGQTEAPAGSYNALAWQMSAAPAGLSAGQVLMLKGQATKESQTVDFTLSSDRTVAYLCGEFVGDERKGTVRADETGKLEATLHFDHLFGDANFPADDALNANALGFEPLAALAKESALSVDWPALKQGLSADQFKTLETALVGLGHVGEGHCRVEQVAS